MADTRFKPGQSGNPAGSSKKQRQRKLLRDFIGDRLNLDCSYDEREALKKHLGEVAAGIRTGDAIAAVVLRKAMKGDADAIAAIQRAEPQRVEATVDVHDAREAALSDQLAGVATERREGLNGRSPHPNGEA